MLQEDRRRGADSDPGQGSLPGRGSSELTLDHRIQEDSPEVESLYRLGAHHKEVEVSWGRLCQTSDVGFYVAGIAGM